MTETKTEQEDDINGDKSSRRKPVRSQNRKNWIKNAIVGLIDQKGIFQITIKSENKDKNLNHINPLIKEGRFIALIVLDQAFDPQKWKNLFASDASYQF